MAAVVFQFTAQAADGDVNGAVERAGLAAAQQIQQHVAGEHTVGTLGEGEQKIVFTAGERNFHAIRVQQPAAGRFQDPAAEAQCLAGAAVDAAVRGVPGAAENSADAGQQFARVEGFRHVVVGAEFEADDAVRFLPHRGQHDDGDVGLAA